METDLTTKVSKYIPPDESEIEKPPPEVIKYWVPDNSYKKSIKEIGSQLTPGEIYRHKLATTAKEERKLRRLEWRWERRLAKWTRAATIVKAGYRGMMGRRYFKAIQADLRLKKEQREAKVNAVEYFKKGEYEMTLETLNKVTEMTCELYYIRAKVRYFQHLWMECFEDTRKAMSKHHLT
jgi:hypothetical protein